MEKELTKLYLKTDVLLSTDMLKKGFRIILNLQTPIVQSIDLKHLALREKLA